MKVQCRMVLMKDGLWGIVSGTEHDPVKLRPTRNLCLDETAEPSLLYLIGDPKDPAAILNKLEGQFQKKTW